MFYLFMVLSLICREYGISYVDAYLVDMSSPEKAPFNSFVFYVYSEKPRFLSCQREWFRKTRTWVYVNGGSCLGSRLGQAGISRVGRRARGEKRKAPLCAVPFSLPFYRAFIP